MTATVTVTTVILAAMIVAPLGPIRHLVLLYGRVRSTLCDGLIHMRFTRMRNVSDLVRGVSRRRGTRRHHAPS